MPLRILLCDDNPDAISSLAILLESYGHETRLCYGGAECISVAREWTPQLVLLDIGMPQVTGYDVARALRGLESGKEAMIVAVTGYAEPDDVRKAYEAGFDLHVKKGADPQHFIDLAARLTTSQGS